MFEKKKESQSQIAPTSETILGYLNLSDGREDPRWQAAVNEAFAHHAADERPWEAVFEVWARDIGALQASSAPAFRDCAQASRVLDIAREILPEYRSYHSDLLGHCSDRELFNSFFIARVLEATVRLVRNDGEKKDSQIIDGAIRELNDFVGYRPVAVLEAQSSGDVYDHEKHRPVPIYIQGAGSVHGPVGEVVTQALQYLRNTPAEVVNLVGLEPDQIREVAVDMRSYDHSHPASNRPNNPFGEWDPSQIELDGRYSRLVIKRSVIDAFAEWSRRHSATRDRELIVAESAALLSATIVMASGVCGCFPGAHDSSVGMATLVPGVARARDAFYRQLQDRMPPHLKEKLVEEERMSKLPFGSIRGFVNSFTAEARALQLQQQQLAYAYAELGLPGSSMQESRKVSTLSSRFQSDIIAHLVLDGFDVENGRLSAGVERLSEVVDTIQRGIECGALADPWNVLGFHGLYPLGSHAHDSIVDRRIRVLIRLSRDLFKSMTILQGEAAASGDMKSLQRARSEMNRFADWWDTFATYQISLDGVEPLHGSKCVQAAEGLASALTKWRERGSVPADMAFWAKNLKSLKSAESLGLVVSLLIRRGDLTGAQGVLVHWLSGVEKIGIGDGEETFPILAGRWLAATAQSPSLTPHGRARQMFHFLAQLEANSTELLEVPTVSDFTKLPGKRENGEKERRYETAFESPDGGLAEIGSYGDSLFDGEGLSEVEEQLGHLVRHAKLIREAVRLADLRSLTPNELAQLARWREEMATRADQTLALAQGLFSIEVPEPESEEIDAYMTHISRITNRAYLVDAAISVAVEQRVITSLLGVALKARGSDVPLCSHEPEYIQHFHTLLGAALASDTPQVRKALRDIRVAAAKETLHDTHLFDGGKPANIARARFNHQAFSTLSVNLARLGYFAPAQEILIFARALGKNSSPDGTYQDNFTKQFNSTFESMVEAVAISAKSWTGRGARPQAIVASMQTLLRPLQDTWKSHDRTLLLSPVEMIKNEAHYRELIAFIQEHGDEVFTLRFLAHESLQGVLVQGTEKYLKWLADSNDESIPTGKFFELIQDESGRKKVAPHLELIVTILLGNRRVFKDYKSSTSMSDYGSNLEKLIALLVVQSKYERDAWQMKPAMVVHQALARHELFDAAALWAAGLERDLRARADKHIQALDEVEKLHGLSLRTIRDSVEQRFIKPLALDRLLALLPAVHREAKAFADIEAEDKIVSAASEERACPSLRRLREGMKVFTEKPEGVGRDVPKWLVALSDGALRARTTPSDSLEIDGFSFAPLVSLDERRAKAEIASLSRFFGL